MVKNRGQSRNGYRNILANVIFSVGEHSEVLQGSASKGTQNLGKMEEVVGPLFPLVQAFSEG